MSQFKGFNSLGDYIPGYMERIGFKNINVSIADKAARLIPPYSRPEEQAYIEELKERVEKGSVGWRLEDIKRYFVAGGGTTEGAENFFQRSLDDDKSILEAVEKGVYSYAGGVVQYLISGYKPE